MGPGIIVGWTMTTETITSLIKRFHRAVCDVIWSLPVCLNKPNSPDQEIILADVVVQQTALHIVVGKNDVCVLSWRAPWTQRSPRAQAKNLSWTYGLTI